MFKPAPTAPRIVLCNNWSLKNEQHIAQLISLCDNQEDFTEAVNKSTTEPQFYYFLDATPEVLLGKHTAAITEEDVAQLYDVLANYEQVEELLSLIQRYLESGYRFGSLVLHSPEGYGRSSCFAIAAEVLQGRKEYDAIFNIVKTYDSCRPNMWVVALIDKILNRQGRLNRAVEEYLATGIAVSRLGEVVEASWES